MTVADCQTGEQARRWEGCRALDLLVAIPALVFFLPLLAVMAIAIKLQDGGPVFYRQQRLGLGGGRFYCIKFRSMAVDSQARLAALLEQSPQARAEWAATHKLKDDPRVTRVGAFLRKSSLDELPQLLNVIRGEMSLVGPRPIVEAEVAYYGDSWPLYCAVLPGITGLWQISGRNDTTYEERVGLDAQYARSKSVALNLKILVKTIPAVLLQRGAY